MSDYNVLKQAGFSDEEILADGGFGADKIQGASQSGGAWADSLNNFASSAMGGVPWGDELSAFFSSGADSLGLEARSLVTGEQVPSGEQLYDLQVKQYRQDGASFDEAYPVGGFFGKMAAGAPLMFAPGLSSGGIAMQGLKGAGLGGLYGSGEGEGEDRLMNAVIGAGTGGIAGAVIPGILKGTGAIAKSAPVQRAYHNVTQPLRGEVGAINIAGNAPRPLPRLTPGEAALAKYADQVPLESLEQGVAAMGEAQRARIPMAVPEATDSPTLLQLNKLIASNDMTDVARTFIKGRQQGTTDRLAEHLKAVSPNASVMDGMAALREGAEGAVKKATELRSSTASPKYAAAEAARPIINIPEVEAVMKSADVAPFIEKLKTRFPNEYGNLPDNHFRMVDQAKQHLDDLIGTARKGGANNEARLLSQMREKLLLSDSLPEYAAARHEFAVRSGLVNKLIGGLDPATGKSVKGLVSGLLNVNEQADITQAGRQLMKKRPEQIRELRIIFGNEYKTNLEAGVRAHIQHLAESGKNGPGQALDFVLSVDGNNKIVAALGKEKAGQLTKLMQMEQKVREGNTASFSGSPTQPNQEAAKRLAGVKKILVKIFASPATTANTLADAMLEDAGKLDPLIMRELAEILNSPQRGQQALRNVHEYRSIVDPRRQKVDALVEALNLGGRSSSRAAIPTAFDE